jgi:recombinational DNA repair ATPase RecF
LTHDTYAEHSNPENLRKMALEPQMAEGGMDLVERRARVQALMEEMKTWPNEADLMQESLATVHNVRSTISERTLALRILQELVEQIDVANGEW